jgi:hypothetical protein
MTSTGRSFAAAAAAASAAVPSATAAVHALPTGPWSVFYHEPEDDSWTADSYKRLQTCDSWESLGSLLRELGPHKTTNGLLRIMRGNYSPLWENNGNIYGGTYCLKVRRRNAIEVFQRYLAAAILGDCTVTTINTIVGVTISPKKDSCIIKIWNLDCRHFSNPTDLKILHEEIKHDEIIYRKQTDQRM